MNNQQDLIGKKVMKDLIIEEYIGSGGFGDVYKAYSLLGEAKLYCAVKHILIPKEKDYHDQLQTMKNDCYATDQYFPLLYTDILNEINLMYQLSGKSRNIVAYQHYDIEGPKGDTKQYEIFIKMEYLTALDRFCQLKDLTIEEVLKIGIDISNAIELCHNENILHRDIKTANIFVNSNGDFKLGDFGLAKRLSEGARAETRVGTDPYKAPEVFNLNGKYDKTIDIYSLGIVLYELFNNGRLPFMPDYPETYGPKDIETAIERRLKGEPLKRLQNLPDIINDVIIKACELNPADRFQTAAEFRIALEQLRNILNKEEISQVIFLSAPKSSEGTAGKEENNWYSLKNADCFNRQDENEDNYIHIDLFNSYNKNMSQETDLPPEENIKVQEENTDNDPLIGVEEHDSSPIKDIHIFGKNTYIKNKAKFLVFNDWLNHYRRTLSLLILIILTVLGSSPMFIPGPWDPVMGWLLSVGIGFLAWQKPREAILALILIFSIILSFTNPWFSLIDLFVGLFLLAVIPEEQESAFWVPIFLFSLQAAKYGYYFFIFFLALLLYPNKATKVSGFLSIHIVLFATIQGFIPGFNVLIPYVAPWKVEKILIWLTERFTVLVQTEKETVIQWLLANLYPSLMFIGVIILTMNIANMLLQSNIGKPTYRKVATLAAGVVIGTVGLVLMNYFINHGSIMPMSFIFRSIFNSVISAGIAWLISNIIEVSTLGSSNSVSTTLGNSDKTDKNFADESGKIIS